jgi:hypothetical protein
MTGDGLGLGTGLFQMEILSFLRTGNPILDAILFALLSYVTTSLLNNYSRTWERFINWLNSFYRMANDEIYFVVESQQSCMDLESYSSGDSMGKEVNLLYHAFAWFINEKKCAVGNALGYKVVTLVDDLSTRNRRNDDYDWDCPLPDEMKTTTDECLFIPTSDVKILWEDQLIFVSHSFIKNNDGDEKGSKFTFRVDENAVQIYEDFCKTIIQEFTEHEQKKKQGQKIYGLVDKCGGKMKWNSKTFRPSNTRIGNIILKGNLQFELEKDVAQFLKSRDVYNRNGVLWKRGYLFYGPPGTGKTSLVKAIAGVTNFNIYNVKLARFESDIDMETNLRQIPRKSIVLFEDIDCMTNIAHNREGKDLEDDSDTDSDSEGSHVKVPATTAKSKKPKLKKPTLSTLLNFLDGVDSPDGIIVIMTTNHVEKLDSALLRDGRIDVRYKLDYCDKEQLRNMISLFFPNLLDAITIDDLSFYEDGKLSPATVSRILMKICFGQHVDPRQEILGQLKSSIQ